MAITPDLQPDVDLKQLALIAAANPVVIGVALYLGRHCDQAGKLIVAGFAAGLAGMIPLYLAGMLHMSFMAEAGRASAGILALQVVFGTIWAALAYGLARTRKS